MRLPTPALTLVLALVATDFLAAQLEYAPEPLEIGERTVVPIDIQRVAARFIFDVNEERAVAVADMWFKAGKVDGTPVFDLRQEIRSAKLDGEEIAVEKLAAHDFGKETGTMRILDEPLKAGTEHHLALEYDLGKPSSPRAKAPIWSPEGVHFYNGSSDLRPGRYLEQWLPVNLIYDQFQLTLEMKVEGAAAEQAHEVVTNGQVQALGDQHWKLVFPEHFTAFSPLVVLIPKAMVERSQRKVKLENGQTIQVDVCCQTGGRSTLEEVHDASAKALIEFSAAMGPWSHGDRCTIFLPKRGGGMEYDGGTSTSMGALRHEIFHSFFGRGAKPSSQNDGWWDEAFTSYFMGVSQRKAQPDRAERGMRSRGARGAGKVALSSSNPWNRVTPSASYGTGAWFFSEVAKAMGETELLTAMSAFFKEHTPNPVSTAQLEAHLIKAAGEKGEAVQDLFHWVVYARPVAQEGGEKKGDIKGQGGK